MKRKIQTWVFKWLFSGVQREVISTALWTVEKDLEGDLKDPRSDRYNNRYLEGEVAELSKVRNFIDKITK